LKQLGIQFVGILAVAIFSLLSSLILWKIIQG